jgi:hypothetical protein
MTPTEELKEYLGEKYKECKGSIEVAKEWNSLHPTTQEEAINAYGKMEGYMYDLAQWHELGTRINLTSTIKHWIGLYPIHKILDFGAGICTDAIALKESQSDLDIIVTDIASQHFSFGLWRIAKRKLDIKSIKIEDMETYDCIILIDVLEHILEIREFIANICQKTTYVLERNPFSCHTYEEKFGDIYPMHTTYQRGMVYSLLEKEGFKAIKTEINDGCQVRLWKKYGNTEK